MPSPRVWIPPIHLNPLRMTPATIAMLNRAHAVADERGHNSVAGEHVLHALLDLAEHQTRWSAGLLLDRLADQERLAAYVAAVVPEQTGAPAPGSPPLAEPLVAALLLAADYAEADARQSVTTADLLIGVLGVQGSISSAILLEAGLRDRSAVADAASTAAANCRALATAGLRGTGAVDALSGLLADLDDRDLHRLGGDVLRSSVAAGNPHAARRWIQAHTANAAEPRMRVGPLAARHPRSMHAVMRAAYAIGDRSSYLLALSELALTQLSWGRCGLARALAAAAGRLNTTRFEDLDATRLKNELDLHADPDGHLHGVPDGVVAAFARVSAEQAWTVLLRFPQLLSPAGLARLADTLDDSTAFAMRRAAPLGSWAVAHTLLVRERLNGPDKILATMNAVFAETATRRAMNYVDGLPADESRSAVTDEGFGDYEFEPSDDLGHESRLSSGVSLAQLIAADEPPVTASYAFQYGQHCQQQVEITEVDLEHLDFAIACFTLAVDNTDPADARHIARAIALSQALELKFTLNRDIRSIEAAAERLWEALYRATPPDASLARLYHRLSELAAIPHSTLPHFRNIPAELDQAAADWPALNPTYDADLLRYPTAVVFAPTNTSIRVARLRKELLDQDGRPLQFWGPGARLGRRWNQYAELALEMAHAPEQTPADRDALLEICQSARENAISTATTIADEAAARFGLVELARARLDHADPGGPPLRALLDAIEHCREHEDQLGSARLRRLAEWSAEAHLRLGQTGDAIDEFTRALAIEERIFSVQDGLRQRILSRSAEPSSVATRLALLHAPAEPDTAVAALERGRALVYRALTNSVQPPKQDDFLPSCESTVQPPETFGRPLSRTAYRTVSTYSRLGIRPQDRTDLPLAPGADAAGIRQALTERNSDLAYLVPGPDGGGALLVPADGSAVFVPVPGLSIGELRRDIPSPEPGDDSAFRMDRWYERFDHGVGGRLWDLFAGFLDPARPLYLVACGITAAFPWAACRPDGAAAVRNLASGTHLITRQKIGGFTPRRCRVLAAPGSPGRERLEFAEAEAQSITTRWTQHGASAEHSTDATVGDCGAALASDLDVCHIVSHAAASEIDPLRQGLALANGYLLTADILAPHARVGADLVILSSCQSGQSAFEVPNEFISLASSLVAKGARGAIGNMWAIDDFTGCVTMQTVHELLLASHQPAEAVALVQQAARSADAEFFTTRAPLLHSGDVPEDFTEDELFAAGSWAGIHYVGL
jgi:hypothetical protein